MSLLKNCRVSVKRAPMDIDPDASSYTPGVVLETRNQDGALLFEGGAIVHLRPYDFSVRRIQFTKLADAFACLGVLTLPASQLSDSNGPVPLSYLVLVTGCTLVGKLPDHEVYRITNVQIISLRSPNSEDDGVSEIRKLLSSGAFFFGRSVIDGKPYDITVNIQDRYRLGSVTAATENMYLRNDIGLDFLWNAGLMYPLLQWGVNPMDWLVPIICGSFDLCIVFCGSEQARMGLISRVSSRRPGTRFHVRGVNDRGYVANFVETEEFVYMGNTVTSHVQIRGTVPLFWEQPGIQVGSHKIQFSRGLELSLNAFERHFMHISSHYGSTAIVNLLGCKQGEALLSRAYQDLHKQSSFKNSVCHIIFDYHSEVQSRGQKSLDWLQKQLERFVNSWGYFHAVDDKVVHWQTGTLRINCVDCLDRTNAVQTIVGLHIVLPRMLQSLNVTTKNQQMLITRFVDSLRQLWQLNGDQVSRIYAGTGALSSGRSKLRDVQRSAARTIQHSLFDTAKQEAMHTLLAQSNLQGWMKTVTEQYLPRRLHCLPPALLSNIMHRHNQFVQAQNLRVFVGTWNVNGGKHFRSVAHKHESVTDWLLDLAKTVKPEAVWGYRNSDYTDEQINKPIDVFAIGFEEIVDLTTSNIVAGSKPTANQRDWGLFLQRHLNRDVHERDSYVLINSVQLVGICLFVFARARLATLFRDIASSSVKTGLGGATGNKGGVAVRFQLGSTSLCFVCSHFAAGQSAVRERNEDFHDIVRRLRFPSGQVILSHDYVFWCGDFNYRINLSAPDVKRFVAQSSWLDLLRSDQLTLERQAGNVFRGFDEGMIRFAPTYKYDLFCDDYDTSEKARSPAWTDRVLWRRIRLRFPKLGEDGLLITPPDSVEDCPWNPGRLLIYNRAELKTSDHRPVGAIFDIDIHVVSRDARRKVVLDSIRDYGPLNAAVQLRVLLTEAKSGQPVATDDSSLNPHRRPEFVELLKTVAGSRKGLVMSVQFVAADIALLVFSNPKQAHVAAEFLNGYTVPWPNPIGLKQIEGGYNVHLSARLVELGLADGQEESSVKLHWLDTLQRLVEIAEREDSASQEPSIAADVFEALLAESDRLAEQEEIGTCVDMGRQAAILNQLGDQDLNDEGASIMGDEQAQPLPPPRRPPAPNITYPLGEAIRKDTQEDSDSRSYDDMRNMQQLATYSTTASPLHSAIKSSGIDQSNLLLSPSAEIQTVASCLDLLSVQDEGTPMTQSLFCRPASSSNLVSEPSLQPAIMVAASSSCNRPPPPLPPRPSRTVHDSGGVASSEKEKDEQIPLSKDQSLPVDDEDHLGIRQPSPTTVSDPNAPLINLNSFAPVRPAPPLPQPPALPPRPKPQE
ncbi:hypothetical protein CRM22_006317 [Opisthorchis felineus]|uniref:phosphoinositide 5-phosphatase n=1 Tax=Opisthorchis felineus TaxID=147828 RepID=A0A4S2LU97_OPIFE|nr:hypothetical protein CRM22_006317 [Opisthorchis felineus]